MLRCEEIEVRRRYRLLILYVDIVDHSIAVNIEKLTRVTAPAASCPLGPAHAGIKMRTHQHTIHCSPAPSSWGGERRQASFWSREKLQLQLHAAAAPVYSPAAQPRVTAARHGQMLQLPGRGGAGSPGGGADCDNILCTGLATGLHCPPSPSPPGVYCRRIFTGRL